MRTLNTTRTRDTVVASHYPANSENTKYSYGSETPQWTAVTQRGLWVDETNRTLDNITPHFTRLRNAGTMFFNDYQNVKVLETYENGPHRVNFIWKSNDTGEISNDSQHHVLTARNFNKDFNGLNCFERVGVLPVSGIDVAADQALTQALSRAKASEMQALVTAAELKKTIQSVGEALRIVTNAGRFLARRAHHGRYMKTDPIKAVDSFSKAWMNYRYGLRLAYFDVRAAMKALDKLGRKTRTRFVSSPVRLTEFEQTEGTRSLTLDSGGYVYDFNWIHNRQRSVTVTAGVVVEPRLNHVGLTRAFGLDQVFQLGWELTRFSFIVDWFIDVGEKIAALSPSAEIAVLGSWVRIDEIELNHTDAEYAIADITKAGHHDEHSIEGDIAYHYYGDRRTVSRYSPQTVSPIPNLNINLDVGKVVDLLAVARSVLRNWR